MNLVVTRMDDYFPVYIYMPKLEPSGKKETFMGYRKSSKDYRIYIPGSMQPLKKKWLSKKEEDQIWRSMTMKR